MRRDARESFLVVGRLFRPPDRRAARLAGDRSDEGCHRQVLASFLTLLEIPFYRKLSERGELALNFGKFVGVDDQKLAFGDHQCSGGYIAGKKKLRPDMPASDFDVGSVEACDVLETLRWNRIADFLMDFANHTLQE